MNKNRLKMNGDPELPNAHTRENAEEVHELMILVHLWVISIAADISTGTVNKILSNDLKLYKISAKFVPKILSEDQL